MTWFLSRIVPQNARQPQSHKLFPLGIISVLQLGLPRRLIGPQTPWVLSRNREDEAASGSSLGQAPCSGCHMCTHTHLQHTGHTVGVMSCVCTHIYSTHWPSSRCHICAHTGHMVSVISRVSVHTSTAHTGHPSGVPYMHTGHVVAVM